MMLCDKKKWAEMHFDIVGGRDISNSQVQEHEKLTRGQLEMRFGYADANRFISKGKFRLI